MQELLLKIIEMDKKARAIEQQAKSEKIKSEEEVEAMREQIYNDYIERAKARIEKNIAIDRAHADERTAAYLADVEQAKSEMLQQYADNKELWVDEIVSRALS